MDLLGDFHITTASIVVDKPKCYTENLDPLLYFTVKFSSLSLFS